VSAGLDGRVIIRDMPAGQVRRIAINSSHPTSAPPNKLRCMAISPDSSRVIVGGDLQASVFNIQLATPQIETITVPNEHGSTIDQLMVYDSGNKLAYITARDEEIVFYDTLKKRIVAQAPINSGKRSHVGRSAASPDSRFIAITTANMVPAKNDVTTFESIEPYKLTLFDTSGAERLSWKFADFADFSFGQIVFPDTRTFVVCLPSGKMHRWTLDSGDKWQPVAEPLRINPGRYTASAASRNGKIVWLAENRRIDGIDSATGKGVAFVELNIGDRRGEYADNPIQAIAATNEPNTVAVAMWDGRVALAKCWALDNSSRPASTAIDLLRRVSEKYGSLSSLSATGRIVTDAAPQNGATPTTLEHTFSINLARPEFYRIEWTNTIKNIGVKLSGAAWSNGEGHRVLMNGNVTAFLNREMALATATGISGGAAHTVPILFFKDEGQGLHQIFSDARALPDDTLEGELCHVVTGKNADRQFTLWITKKDLLLKQSRTVRTGKPTTSEASQTTPLSDGNWQKLLKSMGMDSSPQAVSQMKNQIHAMKETAGAMQITMTEIFDRVTVNDLMIKEDFDVKVPANPPASRPAK
jgi:WD40 repeat protein